MVRADAFIAANRFGLGAGAGEVGDIGADPRGWLLAQLKGSLDRSLDSSWMKKAPEWGFFASV